MHLEGFRILEFLFVSLSPCEYSHTCLYRQLRMVLTSLAYQSLPIGVLLELQYSSIPLTWRY